MNYKKMLRAFHLAGTVWFMLCLVYLLVLVLRQAGFNWWAIFTLSGHLVLLVMLLVSLYLFSIFRGASDSITLQNEHPLTSSVYYMAFYVCAPLLGGAVGLFVMFQETKFEAIFSGIALATMATTFLTWVVVDSTAGSLEMLTPDARKHRSARLADMKLKKQQHEEHRKQLLADIEKQEQKNIQLWQEALASQAARIAELLDVRTDVTNTQQEAIKIGVEAWRMGGLACMKKLHNMASEAFSRRYIGQQYVDYVSVWWDGVGTWRNQPLVSG
jgi:hypothetical protein